MVVLNKIDLVPRKDLQGVISNAALNLGLEPDQIVPIVAKNGKNLGKVLLAIAATEPEMVAALGQALPEYRWQLAWQTIVRSASISAAIALAPLPVIDFVPLVITQSIMVISIARIYNYKITPRRASELVATFGLGFLGRTLFEELSKLGGLPGWLLSAAIASSTTVVMGYAAVHWFEKGEKLSTEALKAHPGNDHLHAGHPQKSGKTEAWAKRTTRAYHPITGQFATGRKPLSARQGSWRIMYLSQDLCKTE